MMWCGHSGSLTIIVRTNSAYYPPCPAISGLRSGYHAQPGALAESHSEYRLTTSGRQKPIRNGESGTAAGDSIAGKFLPCQGNSRWESASRQRGTASHRACAANIPGKGQTYSRRSSMRWPIPGMLRGAPKMNERPANCSARLLMPISNLQSPNPHTPYRACVLTNNTE